MLKKTAALGILFLVLLPFAKPDANAQGDLDSTTTELIEEIEDIPEPFISPNSPFYFLRNWQEWIEGIFANSSEKKVTLSLKQADRRIGEIKHLARIGRTDLLDRTQARWEEKIQKAEEWAEKIITNQAEVKENVLEATSKHLAVLEKVYENAPEQAQEGLQRAINNAQRHQERMLEHFEAKEQKRIEKKVRNRLERFQQKHGLQRGRFEKLFPSSQEE
jgi:hypothetical protein